MRINSINMDKLLIITLLFMNNSSFFPWDYVNKNNQAITEYKKKNYVSAENIFKDIIKEKPDNLDLSFNLADTLYKQKKYIESQSLYLNIINEKTSSGELKQKSHYNLGNALYRLGQQNNPDLFWSNALKEYERALNISPDDKLAKENYDFVKQKLAKLQNQQNNKNNHPPNQPDNKQQPPNQQAYSNTGNQQPQTQQNDVTDAEAENILQDLKLEEENMQDFVNKRELSTEQKKSRSINSLKKDW